MRPLLATILAIMAFPLALALLFTGASIPGQSSGVAPARLAHSASTGKSLEDEAQLLISRGKLGPASWLLRAQGDTEESTTFKMIQDRWNAEPFMRVAGGNEPYFYALHELLENQGARGSVQNGAAGLIITQASRGALSRMLGHSKNQWVQRILEARSITGLPNFPAVSSPAGAPLETSILISALLTQSESLNPEMSLELIEWLELALSRDIAVLQTLDALFLDLLSLSQRMDWESFRTVVQMAGNWEELKWLNAELRARNPDAANATQKIALWLTAANHAELIEYVDSYPSTGWSDLSEAMSEGIQAAQVLVSEKLPIYREPHWLSGVYPALKTTIGEKAIAWTQGASNTLRLIRFGFFALSGILVAGALISFLKHANQLNIQSTKAALASGTTAAMFSLVSWAITEPTLLESTQASTPEIRFNAGPGALMGSLKASTMNPGPIDQVTLIVLGVFLLVQIIIYLVCLVRVGDINKQPVSPALKIALLENEDSLFDTGLYVGLGGTVLSLILVTLGVVEASIMAAYASTLFGIIFVAALKIFHVRPLRRSLILQSNRPL